MTGQQYNPEQLRELRAALRQQAHWYAAELGWRVFPCAAGGRLPALSKKKGGRGFYDAARDPDVIDAMWNRFPLANIGVRTGEASGISVLDVDNDPGGYQSLARLVEQHGDHGRGPVAQTPKGGRHLFFQYRPGLRLSAGQLAPGLDVRSEDSYVVAAPSVRAEGPYTWLVPADTALAPYPAWLVPAAREVVVPLRRPSALGNAKPDKILAGNERIVLEAPEGRRNHQLFVAACFVAEHAVAGRVSFDEGAAVLLNAALSVGLTDTEAVKTIESARRKVGVA